jgi:hypothetical protein
LYRLELKQQRLRRISPEGYEPFSNQCQSLPEPDRACRRGILTGAAIKGGIAGVGLRVDTSPELAEDAESLTLSALTWEAPAATFWVDAEGEIRGAGQHRI